MSHVLVDTIGFPESCSVAERICMLTDVTHSDIDTLMKSAVEDSARLIDELSRIGVDSLDVIEVYMTAEDGCEVQGCIGSCALRDAVLAMQID